MATATGKFTDLGARVASAVVMLAVGGGAIFWGGQAFYLLLIAVGGLMIWELSRMLAPGAASFRHATLAVVGALGFAVSVLSPIAWAALLLAPIAGFFVLQKDKSLFLMYALAVLGAVAALFWIRTEAGLGWTLWLILVVIASDIGGYFFGRILGGPKILPRISPKKTWSGTLGGWLLAAAVGAGFVLYGGAGAGVILLSVVTSFASQAGDVAESAIKRHAGIKDSSNLIPGHGGFLDRFDALIAAALLVALFAQVFGLPEGSMVWR